MNIAIITNAPLTISKGGAERFYDGLAESLKAYGHKVDRIDVPCDESTFDSLLKCYLDCFDLDVSKYDGVISTKAPTYLVQHPNHVCYLVHTTRVFYDMFDEISRDMDNYAKRDLIIRLDSLALSPNITKKIFTIGHEVSERLKKWNNLISEVLYPGVSMGDFKDGDFSYIFMPGRLHRWKRVDLVIESMKYVNSPVRLLISGIGEDYARLKEMSLSDGRIELLGYVDDITLRNLYANALVVPFVPVHEDFGYIAIEAFMSKKPVITCIDSGEPSRIVKNNISGFVVEPSAHEIAAVIDKLYEDQSFAREMGLKGYNDVLNMSWDSVAKQLTRELGEE